MNKTFAMLPPEVRRALARRELERRGLFQVRPADDPAPLLRHATDADLAQMEAILAAHPGVAQQDLPAEARNELGRLLSNIVKATREAYKDVPFPAMTGADELALAERLEAGLHRTA